MKLTEEDYNFIYEHMFQSTNIFVVDMFEAIKESNELDKKKLAILYFKKIYPNKKMDDVSKLYEHEVKEVCSIICNDHFSNLFKYLSIEGNSPISILHELRCINMKKFHKDKI